jgi:hypothetical protein
LLTTLLSKLRPEDAQRELFEQVHAGIPGAATRLIKWIAGHGSPDEADRLRKFGLDPDGSIASGRQTEGTFLS